MEISAFGWFAIGEFAIVMVMMLMVCKIDGGADTTIRHLYFGSVVLTSLTLVFLLGMAMLGMAMYYFAPNETVQAARGKEIFETVKQIVPPLLTLVLGFFFGKRFGPKAGSVQSSEHSIK